MNDIMETKREALIDHTESRKRDRQLDRVLDVIRTHPGLCNKQIAHLLRLPVSSVCGRVNELFDKELVIEHERKVVPGFSETRVKTWKFNEKEA